MRGNAFEEIMSESWRFDVFYAGALSLECGIYYRLIGALTAKRSLTDVTKKDHSRGNTGALCKKS